MNLKDTIRKILKEEVELPATIRRRIKMSEDEIVNYLRKFAIKLFDPNKKIEAIVGKACTDTAYEILDSTHTHIDDETFHSLLDNLYRYLKNKYGEEIKEFIKNFYNPNGNEKGTGYFLRKHSDKDGNSGRGGGFSHGFSTWNRLLSEYGSWFPSLDWVDIKNTLDSMPDRQQLLIATPDDKFNSTGYYFSLVKIKEDKNLNENVDKRLIQKVVRRLYDIEENIHYTAEWTLNHTSASVLREAGVQWFVERVIDNFYIDCVSEIFERWNEDAEDGELEIGIDISKKDEKDLKKFFEVRYYDEIAKYYNDKFPENINEGPESDYVVIKITKPLSRMSAKDYYQAVPLWKTLQDRLFIKKSGKGLSISTKNIEVLKKFKENEKEEMNKYLNKLKDEEVTKWEQTEGELTEKCWKGYTQKGMKTMFGKRYPNCVKKTK